MRALVLLAGWSLAKAAIVLSRFFLLPPILWIPALFAPLAALAVDWRLGRTGNPRDRLAHILWWLNLLPCSFLILVLLYVAYGIVFGTGFGLSDH